MFCLFFFNPSPTPQLPIKEKIRTIAQQVYGAADIELSAEAKDKIDYYTQQVRSKVACLRLPFLTCTPTHTGTYAVVECRALARCPSAWPRPTFLCPTCLTRKERQVASSCPLETSAPASVPASSTHWWGRYVLVGKWGLITTRPNFDINNYNLGLKWP